MIHTIIPFSTVRILSDMSEIWHIRQIEFKIKNVYIVLKQADKQLLFNPDNIWKTKLNKYQ